MRSKLVDGAWTVAGLALLIGTLVFCFAAAPSLASAIDGLAGGEPQIAAALMVMAAASVYPLTLAIGLALDRTDEPRPPFWLVPAALPALVLLCFLLPVIPGKRGAGRRYDHWVDHLGVGTGGAIVYGSLIGLVALGLTVWIVFGLSRGRPGKRAAPTLRLVLPDWAVVTLSIAVWPVGIGFAVLPYL